MILRKDFFAQETTRVAQLLIGKLMQFNQKRGIIIETEAYKSSQDPASHAYGGKTKRNLPMFGESGKIYVYLIYGMYYCCNIVTDKEPGAVLMRGILTEDKQQMSGPGKLSKYYGITIEHNCQDITNHSTNFIKDIGINPNVECTSRIGISKGKDKLWRYICKDCTNIVSYLENLKKN